jgi:hypothetical protein
MNQYQYRQDFRSDINLIKLVIGEGEKKRHTAVFYFNNCTVHIYYLYNIPTNARLIDNLLYCFVHVSTLLRHLQYNKLLIIDQQFIILLSTCFDTIASSSV